MEYIRNEAGVVGFSDAWKIRFYKWLEFPKNLKVSKGVSQMETTCAEYNKLLSEITQWLSNNPVASPGFMDIRAFPG
jgi:hypothetical protein